MNLRIANREFRSRLFIGTGKFGSYEIMRQAIIASESELVTVALKRLSFEGKSQDQEILTYLKQTNAHVVPNTSGARNAKEAVMCAKLGREALETEWIKLEIHPDPYYLMPDPIETLLAVETLVREGFVVMPYVHADPVLCKRLEEAGAPCIMPLASPIGSNRGLALRSMLEIIIEQATIPVVVDAGLGAPSHAADALEMGAGAVLVNTAIAVARDPVGMAEAFKYAVQAGRCGYESGLAGESLQAVPTSPLTAFAQVI